MPISKRLLRFPLTKARLIHLPRRHSLGFVPIPDPSCKYPCRVHPLKSPTNSLLPSAFAAGTTRLELSLPTAALFVHENTHAMLLATIELADESAGIIHQHAAAMLHAVRKLADVFAEGCDKATHTMVVACIIPAPMVLDGAICRQPLISFRAMRFVVNGNRQLLSSFRAFHRPHCQLLVLARLLRQHARLPTLRLPECRSLLPQLLAAPLAPLSTLRLAARRSPGAVRAATMRSII